MPGNPLVRFDEGRVGRTARCRLLSYSTCGSSCSSIAICGRGWMTLLVPHRRWPECMTTRNSLKSRGRESWTAENRSKGSAIDTRGYMTQ